MPVELRSIRISPEAKAKLDARRVAPDTSYKYLVDAALLDAERYAALCLELDRMIVNHRDNPETEASKVVRHLQQIAYGKQ